MLKIRIPVWCEKYEVKRNRKAIEGKLGKGYFALNISAGDSVELHMKMPARRVQAHPYVRQNVGRVAIQRGPVLYCLEGVDNKGNTERELSQDWQPHLEWMENLCGGIMGIVFRDVDGNRVLSVPFFAWDNRVSGTMNVWLRQKGMQQYACLDGWENKLYRFYQ